MSEVVVSLDRSVRHQGQAAEELHSDDGIDEEQHPHKHADVGQSLWLNTVKLGNANRGSIAVRLTSCFTGLVPAVQVNLLFICS